MAQQNINVGTVPNDGTGDTLRNAFIKTQNNFSEFYAAFAPVLASNNVALANNLTAGNSTVNSTANSTSLIVTNASGQTVITAASWSTGNATANMSGNSVYETIANSTANIVMTPSTLAILSTAANLYIGNATASFFVANTSAVQVTGNTLNLGTSNVAGHTASLANGYATMPAGLKLMWGTLTTVNTTAQITTFSTTVGTAFLTNAFAVFATSNNSATHVAVQSVNSTTITLISNNATAQTAYWAALGI
jgi:hypothetical protein